MLPKEEINSGSQRIHPLSEELRCDEQAPVLESDLEELRLRQCCSVTVADGTWCVQASLPGTSKLICVKQ